jgi:hypothetical protein
METDVATPRSARPSSIIVPSPIQAASQQPNGLGAIGMQRVFEKVWAEVERVVVLLRSRLLKDLSDMSLSMDVQERNIG